MIIGHQAYYRSHGFLYLDIEGVGEHSIDVEAELRGEVEYMEKQM